MLRKMLPKYAIFSTVLSKIVVTILNYLLHIFWLLFSFYSIGFLVILETNVTCIRLKYIKRTPCIRPKFLATFCVQPACIKRALLPSRHYRGCFYYEYVDCQYILGFVHDRCDASSSITGLFRLVLSLSLHIMSFPSTLLIDFYSNRSLACACKRFRANVGTRAKKRNLTIEYNKKSTAIFVTVFCNCIEHVIKRTKYILVYLHVSTLSVIHVTGCYVDRLSIYNRNPTQQYNSNPTVK